MKKVLLGGITGGVVFFFLGWLIYGVILMNFTTANYNQCSARPMAEMVWWAMILSNFALGFLLSIVINWSKANGIIAGAMVAGFIGLLLAITIDFSMYSMSTMFLKFTAVIIDIIAYTFMSTVAGAIIAGVMGLVKAKD